MPSTIWVASISVFPVPMIPGLRIVFVPGRTRPFVYHPGRRVIDTRRRIRMSVDNPNRWRCISVIIQQCTAEDRCTNADGNAFPPVLLRTSGPGRSQSDRQGENRCKTYDYERFLFHFSHLLSYVFKPLDAYDGKRFK